jgi:hypothetical protein
VEDAIATIRGDIPRALARLEAAGYPGVEQWSVAERHGFRKKKTKIVKVGGWRIASYTTWAYGDPHENSVVLLSDGRLKAAGPDGQAVTDPADIVRLPDRYTDPRRPLERSAALEAAEKMLFRVQAGLQALLERLGPPGPGGDSAM